MPRAQIHDTARVAAFVLGASRTRYLVMRQEDVWFITFNGEEFGPYRSEREASVRGSAGMDLRYRSLSARVVGRVSLGHKLRFGSILAPLLRR